jgi:hypothetical protein
MKTQTTPAQNVQAFLTESKVSASRMLQLLQQWRRAQAGSSKKKCHSSVH